MNLSLKNKISIVLLAIFILYFNIKLEKTRVIVDKNVTTVVDKNTISDKNASVVKKNPIISSPFLKEAMDSNDKLSGKDKSDIVTGLEQAKLKYPDVPSSLIYATAITESSVNPRVKHPNPDDIGLCGINAKYHLSRLRELGIANSVKDLRKTKVNIMACASFYSDLLHDSRGSIRVAIHKYKGTNLDGRVDKLYTLYKSISYKVTRV